MELINTWQFNIVAYLISVVVFFQFYKLAVKNATKDGAATILVQMIAGLFALGLSPLFVYQFPTNPRTYLLLFAAIIFYAVFDRMQTTVRKHLEVSVFSILNQFATIFVIFYGITIFREPIVIYKVIGAGFILLGNILVFYKRGSLKLNSYALLGIVSTLIYSIAISIDVGISKQFNLPLYVAITLLLPAVLIFITERHSIKALKAELKPEVRKYYLYTGLAWTLTIIFALRSYNFGEVTTVAPLHATSVILNVVVAYLLLNEKSDELKKFIAAILVMIGIYLTTIG